MNHTMGRLSLVLLAGWLCCLVAFRLVGSTVDSKGVLHEPFGLLPIGWLLAGAGAATGGVAIVRRQPPRQP